MVQKQIQRQIPNLSKIEHIVTHNGVFHADECFAIAFLNIATGRHPANEDLFDVIRVNNTDIEQYKDREDCIIIDIGDGEFDHHSNKNKEYRSYARKGSDGEKEYKVIYPSSAGGVGGSAYRRLFNIDNLDVTRPLIVCEGIMDIVKIWSYIDKNVTCTYGASLKPQHKRDLQKFKDIIVFSDSDEGGEHRAPQKRHCNQAKAWHLP